MLKVEVKKGNIERALKELKSKCIKTKVLQQYRDKKELIKPSEKKRKSLHKAIYIENKKRKEEF